MVAQSSCAVHMIPEGVCIPEAEGLLSNQSSGHISVGWGALGEDDGVNPEEMRWG